MQHAAFGRTIRAFAIATVAGAFASGAFAQTTASLVATDTCLNAVETTLTVQINMTGATDVAVGGQFFLQYDATRLTYMGGAPGAPFTFEFLDASPPAPPGLGYIDYAVGLPLGGSGTMSDTTMGTLTFAIAPGADACNVSDLISFRPHIPPTRISNNVGTNILATTNNLGSIRIDKINPVLTVTSGLTAADACANAPSVGPGTYQFSTLSATVDGSPAPCAFSGQNSSADVWYLYVPTASGSLSVTTCSLTTLDTILEAFTGCGGTSIACNDDTNGACGLQSTISMPVTNSIPVLVRVSGWNTGTGSGLVSFNFTPATPAASDLCGSAVAVNEGTYPFDTTGGNAEVAATCQVSGPDSWIRYVPTFTGTQLVETCGLSAFDTVLSAHSAPCGPETACNDDSCGLLSSMSIGVANGTPVWIRIARYNGGAASGSVRIGPPPAPPAFTLNRVVKADAGLCSALVSWGSSATDNCDPSVGIVATLPGPTVITSPHVFPVGTSTVTVTATDDCGNTHVQTFTVTVQSVSEMVADVELNQASLTTFTRCITFDLRTGAMCPGTTVDQTLTFSNRRVHAIVDVPCGLYSCVSARDRLHTLRRTDDDGDFQIVGTRYRTNFTATGATNDSLLGGNFNDDEFIEILDFGIFIGQFPLNIGANTTCATPAPHADASGNGIVDLADFTYIQTQFLFARELDCCGNLVFGKERPPIVDISNDELVDMGYASIRVADLNHDGRLNVADITAFMNGARPCGADWNGDGSLDSRDFFEFISGFLTGQADFNFDGVTDSTDFFTFLTIYFAGC